MRLKEAHTLLFNFYKGQKQAEWVNNDRIKNGDYLQKRDIGETSKVLAIKNVYENKNFKNQDYCTTLLSSLCLLTSVSFMNIL
jgi:hypothetical protein